MGRDQHPDATLAAVRLRTGAVRRTGIYMIILRHFLSVVAVAALAACAEPGAGGGVQPASSSPRFVVKSAAPPEPVAPAAESPFATVSVENWTTVQDAALPGVTFQIVGRCTVGEVEGGRRVLLLWPDGYVEFDKSRGVVRFTDVVTGEVTEFAVGQVVDFRVTPGGSDRGPGRLPSDVVSSLDPSCVYEDYVIVTGVTIR